MRHLRETRREITEVSCKTSSIRSAAPENQRERLILSPIPSSQYGGTYLGFFLFTKNWDSTHLGHRFPRSRSQEIFLLIPSQLLSHIVLVINPPPQGSWNYLKNLRRKGPPVSLGVLTVTEVFLLLV